MQWLLVVFLILISVLGGDTFEARNAIAPYITTVLEPLDGSRIALRFQALTWDPTTMAAIQQIPEQQAYYNDQVLSRWGTLTTNVKLKLGPYALNPGSYTTGFMYQESSAEAVANATGMPPSPWRFVLGDESRQLIQIPIPMTLAENTVPFLSYVFSPGITDRDFVMTFLFGPYTANLKWTITGIPAQSSSLPSFRSVPETEEYTEENNPIKSTPPVSSVAEQVTIFPEQPVPLIQEATPSQTLPPTQGLGAFRRLFKSAEELRGRLNQ